MDKETAEVIMRTSEAIDALTEEIRQQGHHLVEYIRSMQESIDDLRTEIQHALRNLLPEFQLKSMAKDPCDPRWAQKLNNHSELIAEAIHCFECDAQMGSLAEALQNGWTELCRDDGVSWNYLGLCPKCVNQEIEEIAQMQPQLVEVPKPPNQSTLF